MIGITTEKGKLRIVAELDIPQGQHWGPGRINRLMMDLERYVFVSELADKADSEARKENKCATLPARKGNFKSGLVIDA